LSVASGFLLFGALRLARHQRVGIRMTCGVFAAGSLGLGVLHIVGGLGHPPLSEEEETRAVVALAGGLICMVVGLIIGVIKWLRPKKSPTTSLHSTPR
jgi:hypothetical protein